MATLDINNPKYFDPFLKTLNEIKQYENKKQ